MMFEYKDFIEQIKASLIESEAEKDARSCGNTYSAAAEGKAEESERSNISGRLPAEEKAKVQTSQWTHEEVLALLCSYEQHKDEFEDPSIRNGEVWVHIADDLSSGHIQKTPSLFEKKWSNLKIRYTSIKDAMIKSGAGRSGWVYFEKMDQILHRDKATEPAATSNQ
ncbi:uncharacterized protein LOC144620649 [Crassostrea virginica]